MYDTGVIKIIFDIGASILIGIALGGIVYAQLLLSFFIKKLFYNSKYRKFLTIIFLGFISIGGFLVVVVIGRFARKFLSGIPTYESMPLALLIFSIVIYGLIKASRLLEKQRNDTH